jgi:hypothetical protein
MQTLFLKAPILQSVSCLVFVKPGQTKSPAIAGRAGKALHYGTTFALSTANLFERIIYHLHYPAGGA